MTSQTVPPLSPLPPKKARTNSFLKNDTKLMLCRDHDQKLYVELKKVYFLGNEIHPGVMRAQKRDIQLFK
jgi:hypothetical protein